MSTVSHVVLVSWKAGKGPEAEAFVRPAIRDFARLIPGVEQVVEGHSSSPEGLENGYEYGFVITFGSAETRDEYLDHPTHRPVGDAIGAAAERIVVFDI